MVACGAGAPLPSITCRSAARSSCSKCCSARSNCVRWSWRSRRRRSPRPLRIGLGNEHQYTVPPFVLSTPLVAWSIVCGPLFGFAAYGFVRLTHVPGRTRRKTAVAGARTDQLRDDRRARDGLPSLLGNGRRRRWLRRHVDDRFRRCAARAESTDRGRQPAGGCGRRPADTGLANGALLGVVLGGLWSLVWPGASIGGCALIGATAFLAASMQMPITAVAAARIHARGPRQPRADAACGGRLARCVPVRAAAGGAAGESGCNREHACDGRSLTHTHRSFPPAVPIAPPVVVSPCFSIRASTRSQPRAPKRVRRFCVRIRAFPRLHQQRHARTSLSGNEELIQRISQFFTQVVHRVLPDPLIFAILLTIVTFALAFGLTPNTPVQLTTMGFGFLEPARVLDANGDDPRHRSRTREFAAREAHARGAREHRDAGQGVMLVAFVGALACAINWGFGLVLGAMLARAKWRVVSPAAITDCSLRPPTWAS